MIGAMVLRAAQRTLLFATAVGAALAQTPGAPSGDLDLADLTLEQLMKVPVEVGGRRAEPLASTPASVFVLNEPEIRRSGMRSVGELLRLVPGLVIAQDVPGAYGFSSRLGEYEFSGMLVLIDGQRLYPTLLRREYFQAIDLPVDIIARIEVVRGPGGARWGDQASQGVINIVTKKAADCRGGRVAARYGSEEPLASSFRVGAAIDSTTDFYVFGKLAHRDGGHPTTSGDRWDNHSIGGRVDAKVTEHANVTVDGLYHDSFLGDSFEIDPGFSSLNDIKGGHLKSRLHFDHDGGDWTELRGAVDGYDQDIRDFRNNAVDEQQRYREQLFDLTAQHAFRISDHHTLTLGLGVRSLTVRTDFVVGGGGRHYNETRGDAFASWEWSLTDELRLTLGGNLGYQDGLRGSGIDVQPDARLAWTPDPDLTVWTAFSANREPDRKLYDSGLLVRRPSSHLYAWELGLRRRFGENLLVQVDSFVYRVTDQINDFPTDPGTGATLYTPGGDTQAFGGELGINWNPADHVHVTSFLATTEANSQHFDPTVFSDADTIEGQVPRLRGGATLGWDPVPGLELDSNLLYTQRRAGIPTWWRLDLRLGWRPSERTLLEVVGQNLTDPHHPEYFYLEEPQRGYYMMVTWYF